MENIVNRVLNTRKVGEIHVVQKQELLKVLKSYLNKWFKDNYQSNHREKFIDIDELRFSTAWTGTGDSLALEGYINTKEPDGEQLLTDLSNQYNNMPSIEKEELTELLRDALEIPIFAQRKGANSDEVELYIEMN
ncbi:MAG: hypothetical protein ACOCQR_00950 [bacterium]